MRQFQRKERIGASVHRVWSILTDIARWPEWTASVTRIEDPGSRPLGLGSRVRIHQLPIRIFQALYQIGKVQSSGEIGPI